MEMLNKKAAMFGLDARIALAIFGALSVISGAALYSAIQSAKAERYRQHFIEISKASEQYLLDNGQHLPQFTNTTLYSRDLVANRQSLSTWRGPYIAGEVASSFSFRDSVSGLVHATDANFEIALKSSAFVDCGMPADDCYENIVLFYANADMADSGYDVQKGIFDLLDSLVDSSDGESAGKVRFITGGGWKRIYYKTDKIRKRTS